LKILVSVDDRAKLVTQTDLIKFIAENDKENPLMEETVATMAEKYSWNVGNEVIQHFVYHNFLDCENEL
jgi:hypothetical protein